MNLHPTPRFIEEYNQLSERLQKQADKALNFLLNDLRYPSLRVKKMENEQDPVGREIWEARISQGYRFTFVIDDDNYILRRIGKHDILRTP